MCRAALVSLVLLAVSGVACRVDAKVVRYEKLKPEQVAQLDASEQRLAIFDRKLQQLELERKRHQISRTEYGYEAHELTAFIAAEARFQNDILIEPRRPFLDDDAQDVMSNIVRYGIIYPAEAIAYLAIRVGPGLVGMIH